MSNTAMPFGVMPAGQPLITTPSATPAPTSFLYNLSASKPFSHIVVFLLPGIALPENTAAAIYVASTTTASSGTPNFTFLGAVGPGKESAVFKVGSGAASEDGGGTDLMVGIEVEPADVVASRLQEQSANKTATGPIGRSRLSTAVLAQRIIQNAFNFLASFSGNLGPGGVEVVPLKAFENWWRKFESRVRADPSFLEQQQPQ